MFKRQAFSDEEWEDLMAGEDQGPKLVAMEGKTDQDRAREYKTELERIAPVICDLMDRANKDGLVIQFGFGRNAFGKNALMNQAIVKIFD